MNTRKVLFWLLAVGMIFSLQLNLFAGGEEEVARLEAGAVTFPYTGPEIELTIGECIAPIAEDWDAKQDTMLFQEFSRLLGNVKLNKIVVNEDEKVKIYFATGEMPFDIVTFWNGDNYATTYGPTGTLLDLSLYEYAMPNIEAVAMRYPNIKLGNFADGSWYAVAASMNTNEARFLPWYNWRFNAYFLKEAGMEVPETPDELLEYLRAVKRINPDSWPFLLSYNDYIVQFNRMFGITKGIAYNPATGKFENGIVENAEQVRKMLTYMNTLYDEALIPKDFMTLSWDTIRPVIYNNHDAYGVTAWMLHDAWGEEDAIKKLQESDPDFDLVFSFGVYDEGIEYQVEPAEYAGSKAWFGNFVNAKTENPEFATSFLNYMSSATIRELNHWGLKGKTFTVLNGVRRPMPDTKIPANPNGTVDTLEMYGFHATDTIMNPAGFLGGGQPGNYEVQARLSPFHLTRIEPFIDEWLKGPDEEKLAPFSRPWEARPGSIVLTKEESDIVATTMDSYQKYVDEMYTKFILGQIPLSDFDSFIDVLANQHNIDDVIDLYNSKPLPEVPINFDAPKPDTW